MTAINFAYTCENRKETRDYDSQRQSNSIFYKQQSQLTCFLHKLLFGWLAFLKILCFSSSIKTRED